MTEKIYGVTGLMEWDALIVCGKARLRVRFEGGSSSGFGDAPAIYRTTNPAAQHIIENSSYFREKRIRLLRVNRYKDPEESGPADTVAGDDNPGAAPAAVPKGVLTLEEKHFNDPQLARRFLHDDYGVPMAKMLSYASIRQAGELYGFKITWDK